MTPVRGVPDVTGEEVAVGAGVVFFLERRFQCKKTASKPQNAAYFANLYWGIKSLRRSDPGLSGQVQKIMNEIHEKCLPYGSRSAGSVYDAR